MKKYIFIQILFYSVQLLVMLDNELQQLLKSQLVISPSFLNFKHKLVRLIIFPVPHEILSLDTSNTLPNLTQAVNLNNSSSKSNNSNSNSNFVNINTNHSKRHHHVIPHKNNTNNIIKTNTVNTGAGGGKNLLTTNNNIKHEQQQQLPPSQTSKINKNNKYSSSSSQIIQSTAKLSLGQNRNTISASNLLNSSSHNSQNASTYAFSASHSTPISLTSSLQSSKNSLNSSSIITNTNNFENLETSYSKILTYLFENLIKEDHNFLLVIDIRNTNWTAHGKIIVKSIINLNLEHRIEYCYVINENKLLKKIKSGIIKLKGSNDSQKEKELNNFGTGLRFYF